LLDRSNRQMNQLEKPVDSMPDEGKQYLVFREGPFTLALAIDNIKRVHEAVTVPQRRPGTRLIDIHRMTGTASETLVRFWVEIQMGKGHYLMPINNVEGIREMNLAIPMKYPEALKKEDMDFISRLFFDGSRMIVEIDSKALLELTESENALLKNLKKIRERKNRGALNHPDSEEVQTVEKKDPQEDADTFSDDKKMLFFKTDDNMWALDFKKIMKIIDKDEIHKLPGIGKSVVGAVYHDENAVPVIIPGKNDVNDQKGKSIEKIILTESPRGMVGFGCDQIIQIAMEKDKDQMENGPDNCINIIKPELVVENLI
jgi:chemotaxis signal transduction protein